MRDIFQILKIDVLSRIVLLSRNFVEKSFFLSSYSKKISGGGGESTNE